MARAARVGGTIIAGYAHREVGVGPMTATVPTPAGESGSRAPLGLASFLSRTVACAAPLRASVRE